MLYRINKLGPDSKILHTPARRISVEEIENFKPFIDNMMETANAQGNCAGLAATQVWSDPDTPAPAIFITIPDKEVATDPKVKWLLFINPKVVGSGRTIKAPEGCLSIPGVTHTKSRKKNATVTYLDIEGVEHVEKFSGLMARIMQHEDDHLKGRTLIKKRLAHGRRIY